MKLYSKPIALILITALLALTFMSAISINPAAASPGQNLLTNPSFEEGTEWYRPESWTNTEEWIGVIQFSSETAPAPHGTAFLSFYSESAYEAQTSQAITSVTSGTYTLSAIVQSYGTINETYMFVRGHGGDEIIVEIPKMAEGQVAWTEISTEVEVTSGQVTIGFYVDAEAQAGVCVDNVFFGISDDGEQSQAPSQAQSQAPSQAQSQAPSQAQSQAPSQAQSQAPSQAQSQAPSQAQSQAPSQAASQTESKGSTNTGDTTPMLYILLMLALATAVIFVTIPKKASN